MTFRLQTVFASLAVFLFAARPARADVATRTFALIVTNNRSGSLSMPELQYADDDGARYYRLFRSLAGEREVTLLTTFDRASRSAYPDLAAAARPPIKSELERAIRELAREITAARERGERTAFYFVFAGHGDVSKGRGYLELEDAQIDGAFLEKEVIERIGTDTKHILLDSCNSFFVINPRKPGGRRWATPKDMALGFSARHPEVGLYPAVASRGDRIFASLFDRPYGPSSFANYLQEVVVATEPVYGISEADLVRVRNYLSAFAEEDAYQSRIWGWAPLATGSALVAASIVEFAGNSGDREARFNAISQGGGGVAAGALGLWILSTPSEGEKALRAFDEELRSSPGNAARAFARAEERFAALAKREGEVRRSRLFLTMLLGGVIAAGATAKAVVDHSQDRPSTSNLARFYGISAFVFASGIFLFGSESSTERLIHIYRDDPGLKLHFSLTPGPSSLGASLSGRF